MRLETLETSMRREQTKAEAVARLMASFASHLQVATTDAVREEGVHSERQQPSRYQQATAQPTPFFADLHPQPDTMTVRPKPADPVRPTNTEQRPAASASATADIPDDAIAPTGQPRQPQPASVPSTAGTAPVATAPATTGEPASAAASGASAPSAAAASKPATSSAPEMNTSGAASEPGSGANAPAQKSASSATEPASGDTGTHAETPGGAINPPAPADVAVPKPVAEAKHMDAMATTAEQVAVATKATKSATQGATKGDDVAAAPALASDKPAATTAITSPAVKPDVTQMASRAAASATPPAEAIPMAPLASTPSANPLAMGSRPRAGASQPAEAAVAGEANQTPASAKAGTPAAGALDGADAIIRPQADGGLLVTLAPSGIGPVQVKLDVAGGGIANLVFIAPYQQTRNNLEALRPAIAAATRNSASMRILSSSRSDTGALQESEAKLPGNASRYPHIDVKV